MMKSEPCSQYFGDLVDMVGCQRKFFSMRLQTCAVTERGNEILVVNVENVLSYLCICPKCEREFIAKSSLEKHMNTHLHSEKILPDPHRSVGISVDRNTTKQTGFEGKLSAGVIIGDADVEVSKENGTDLSCSFPDVKVKSDNYNTKSDDGNAKVDRGAVIEDTRLCRPVDHTYSVKLEVDGDDYYTSANLSGESGAIDVRVNDGSGANTDNSGADVNNRRDDYYNDNVDETHQSSVSENVVVPTISDSSERARIIDHRVRHDQADNHDKTSADNERGHYYIGADNGDIEPNTCDDGTGCRADRGEATDMGYCPDTVVTMVRHDDNDQYHDQRTLDAILGNVSHKPRNCEITMTDSIGDMPPRNGSYDTYKVEECIGIPGSNLYQGYSRNIDPATHCNYLDYPERNIAPNIAHKILCSIPPVLLRTNASVDRTEFTDGQLGSLDVSRISPMVDNAGSQPVVMRSTPAKKSAPNHQCTTCLKDFTRSTSLKRHITSAHDHSQSVKCSVCEKPFRSVYDRNRHVEQVHQEKKFQCQTCLNSYTSQVGLQKHMQRHVGNFSFTCSICGKGYPYQSSYKTHMARHSGLKEHKCETCHKSFTLITDLNRHSNRCGRKDSTFQCCVCGKTFASGKYLESHKKIHNSTGQYQCDQCGKAFQQHSSLRRHCRKIHEM